MFDPIAVRSQVNYRDRKGREPRQARKISDLWTRMCAADFTTKQLAKECDCHPRFVRAYVKALADAGYIEALRMRHGPSPHTPQHYAVIAAKSKLTIAPQMHQGRLGANWLAVQAEMFENTPPLPERRVRPKT